MGTEAASHLESLAEDHAAIVLATVCLMPHFSEDAGHCFSILNADLLRLGRGWCELYVKLSSSTGPRIIDSDRPSTVRPDGEQRNLLSRNPLSLKPPQNPKATDTVRVVGMTSTPRQRTGTGRGWTT